MVRIHATRMLRLINCNIDSFSVLHWKYLTLGDGLSERALRALLNEKWN
ncbi:hypothetical protein QE436_003956 [Pantoea anthophila]|nr:hypothetical protein [Pantoea anthophila]